MIIVSRVGGKIRTSSMRQSNRSVSHVRRLGYTACLLAALSPILSADSLGQEQPAQPPAAALMAGSAPASGGDASGATLPGSPAQATGSTIPPDASGPAPAATGEGGPTHPAAAAPRARVPEAGLRWDTIYLPNARGELVPVPLDADLQEFLDWRAKKNAANVDVRPAFGISSIALSGTAGDERAELTAVIRVQIDRAGEWVQVPLRLNEAVLRETAYEGPGKAAFDDFDREAGYRWSFQGEGLHTLTLSLFVPVRKQSPSRRLQLALPPSAVGHVRISVPLKRIAIRPGDPPAERDPRSTVRTRILDDATEIEIFGLDQRLDLNWQPLPDPAQVATVLESHTLISVQPTIDSVLLTSVQTVQARQGSFDSLTVRLPAGFELVALEGRQYASHSMLPDGRVAVRLTEPGTGPVELRWTLQTPLPETGGVLLEGFEVEHARRQTGEVALVQVEGLRVARLEAANVHRINVGDLVGQIPQLPLTSAYRFLRQPFRLGIAVTPNPPGFTVQQEQRLHFSGQRAELTADFRIRVYRGVVETLDLVWPNRRAEGWVIEPPDLFAAPGEGAAVELFELEADEAGEIVRVHLRDRQSGDFTLRVRAARKFLPEPEASVITLPGIEATSPSPTDLFVTSADAVEVQLEPTAETALEWLEASDAPEHVDHYRVPGSAPMLAVRLAVHDQIVQASARVNVELADGRLLVREEIAYDVRYERLPQVRLLVPRELGERVRFRGPDGALVSPMWTRSNDGAHSQATIRFAEPRIGRFGLTAEYVIDPETGLPPAAPFDIAVPLLLPAEAAIGSVVVSTPPAETVEIVVSAPEWQRQATFDEHLQWRTTAAAASIPLRLERAAPDVHQHYVVRRALLRTAFDRNGDAASRAQFRLDGEFTRLLLHIPRGQVVRSVWWDQQSVSEERLVLVDEVRGLYRLEIADETTGVVSGEHLLTLELRGDAPPDFSWTDACRIPLPGFPGHVRVEQSVVDIVLPADMHLFAEPRGLTPLYEWRRGTVFWWRQPWPAYSDLEAWIGKGGPPREALFENGNSYRFGRFGAIESIQFQAMSQPLIVLLGAGLALAVGFVLLKIPAARDALTVLIVAFVAALAGLWYAEPVRVLLQPALLGLLLAVMAAAIEYVIQRRRGPSIITLSTASDFYAPVPGGSGHYRAFPAGAEDPTAVRPPPASIGEPLSTTASREG